MARTLPPLRIHWRSVRDGVGRELRIYGWAGGGGFQQVVT